MKNNKIQKNEITLQTLSSNKVTIPNSQLKGIKGGIVEENAEGF